MYTYIYLINSMGWIEGHVNADNWKSAKAAIAKEVGDLDWIMTRIINDDGDEIWNLRT